MEHRQPGRPVSLQDGAVAARHAHNVEAAGASPAPAPTGSTVGATRWPPKPCGARATRAEPATLAERRVTLLRAIAVGRVKVPVRSNARSALSGLQFRKLSKSSDCSPLKTGLARRKTGSFHLSGHKCFRSMLRLERRGPGATPGWPTNLLVKLNEHKHPIVDRKTAGAAPVTSANLLG